MSLAPLGCDASRHGGEKLEPNRPAIRPAAGDGDNCSSEAFARLGNPRHLFQVAKARYDADMQSCLVGFVFFSFQRS